MTKILTANVPVTGPHGPIVLLTGTEVPEWAADQVGDHVLAEAPTDTKPEDTTDDSDDDKNDDGTTGSDDEKDPEDEDAAADTDDEKDDEDADDTDDESPDFTGPAPRARRPRKKA